MLVPTRMMKPDKNSVTDPRYDNNVSHGSDSSKTTSKLGQRSRSFSFTGLARLSTGLHKYTVTSLAEHTALNGELTTSTATQKSNSFRSRANSDSSKKSRSTRLKLPKFRRRGNSMMPSRVKLVQEREQQGYGCTLPSDPTFEGSICFSDTISFTVSPLTSYLSRSM